MSYILVELFGSWLVPAEAALAWAPGCPPLEREVTSLGVTFSSFLQALSAGVVLGVATDRGSMQQVAVDRGA
jgi:hypothetical protein